MLLTIFLSIDICAVSFTGQHTAITKPGDRALAGLNLQYTTVYHNQVRSKATTVLKPKWQPPLERQS